MRAISHTQTNSHGKQEFLMKKTRGTVKVKSVNSRSAFERSSEQQMVASRMALTAKPTIYMYFAAA